MILLLMRQSQMETTLNKQFPTVYLFQGEVKFLTGGIVREPCIRLNR